MDTQNTPESGTPQPRHLDSGPRRHSFVRTAALLAAVGLVTLATGAFAFGRGMGHGPWHGPKDPEAMREHGQRMVNRVLDKIDATDAQQQEIQAILDGAWQRHSGEREQHKLLHDQLQTLLTADSIDRDAMEALRQQQAARMEVLSQELTNTLADVAEVLTPEQRRELAKMHAERFE